MDRLSANYGQHERYLHDTGAFVCKSFSPSSLSVATSRVTT